MNQAHRIILNVFSGMYWQLEFPANMRINRTLVLDVYDRHVTLNRQPEAMQFIKALL